jgi:hypothetical protein
VVHMSMPPMLEARSYWAMWMFGKHICDSIVENHLTTCDSMCSNNLWTIMCFRAKWPKTGSCKIGICRRGWGDDKVKLWGTKLCCSSL